MSNLTGKRPREYAVVTDAVDSDSGEPQTVPVSLLESSPPAHVEHGHGKSLPREARISITQKALDKNAVNHDDDGDAIDEEDDIGDDEDDDDEEEAEDDDDENWITHRKAQGGKMYVSPDVPETRMVIKVDDAISLLESVRAQLSDFVPSVNVTTAYYIRGIADSDLVLGDNYGKGIVRDLGQFFEASVAKAYVPAVLVLGENSKIVFADPPFAKTGFCGMIVPLQPDSTTTLVMMCGMCTQTIVFARTVLHSLSSRRQQKCCDGVYEGVVSVLMNCLRDQRTHHPTLIFSD